MLIESYEQKIASVWATSFPFGSLAAAFMKGVLLSLSRLVFAGPMVLGIYLVSMIPANAEIFDQRLVDNGRQIATVAIQFPAGWQRIVDPQNDQLNIFTSGLGGMPWCGLQMNRQVAYQSVTAATTLDRSFQALWGTMLSGQQVLQMGPSKYWNTNGGTVVYAGTAIVNWAGTATSVALFLAEGRAGGRISAFYHCNDGGMDTITLPQAAATLSSVVIGLTPASGGINGGSANERPPVSSRDGDTEALNNANHALATQRSISNMSQDLFTSHSNMMSSMYPAYRH